MTASTTIALALCACVLALVAEGYWPPPVAAPAKPVASYWDTIKDRMNEYKGENVYDLQEMTALQTISGSPDHATDMSAAARWLVGRLKHLEIQNTQVFDTDGVHPVVYGDWLLAGADRPTILIYGSFDIPPLNPLLSWDEPYTLGLQDAAYWGRGVSSGKGAMLTAIQAVEIIVRTEQMMGDMRTVTLPFNVKFLLESQAEIGSPGLKAFLQQHRDLLSADICLSSMAASSCEPRPDAVPAVPDTLGNRAAMGAWKEATGKLPTWNMDTSCLPALVDIQSELGLPVTAFGWGLGEGMHQPNEHLKIADYKTGREAWIRLLLDLSKGAAAEELVAAREAKEQAGQDAAIEAAAEEGAACSSVPGGPDDEEGRHDEL